MQLFGEPTWLRDHSSLFPAVPLRPSCLSSLSLPNSPTWSMMTLGTLQCFSRFPLLVTDCTVTSLITNYDKTTTADDRSDQPATSNCKKWSNNNTQHDRWDIDSLYYVDISWIIRDSESLLILLIIFSDMSLELLVHKKKYAKKWTNKKNGKKRSLLSIKTSTQIKNSGLLNWVHRRWNVSFYVVCMNSLDERWQVQRRIKKKIETRRWTSNASTSHKFSFILLLFNSSRFSTVFILFGSTKVDAHCMLR